MPELLGFEGHSTPKANWTWVPPEFFDVVLRTRGSLSEVRLLAYLIRRARGQETSDWLPQDAELSVSFSDFVRAGVHRSAIGDTLNACEAAGFIKRLQRGNAGGIGASGSHALRWSASRRPKLSDCGRELPEGFCGAMDRQIAVPNTFLDVTVREHSLRVIKVVAAFVLRCLGYSAEDGIRRREVPLSTSQIQALAGIPSRRNCVTAIDEALAANQLQMRVKPHFASGRSAIYALRWVDDPEVHTDPEPAEAGCILFTDIHADDAEGVEDRGGVKSDTLSEAGTNQAPGSWYETSTGSGTERAPGAGTEQAPGVGGKALKALKALEAKQKPFQQQQLLEPAAAENGIDCVAGAEEPRAVEQTADQPCTDSLDALVRQLVRHGVDASTAADLVAREPVEEIERQLGLESARSPARNPGGRLVRAIRERWSAPLGVKSRQFDDASSDLAPDDVVAFARGVYAGTAGVDPALSVAEPDPLDIRGCNRIVAAIGQRHPGIARSAAEWGWALGAFVVAYKRRHERGVPMLGITAGRMVSMYGDAFMQSVQARQVRFRDVASAQSAPAELVTADQPVGARNSQVPEMERFIATAERVAAAVQERETDPICVQVRQDFRRRFPASADSSSTFAQWLAMNTSLVHQLDRHLREDSQSQPARV